MERPSLIFLVLFLEIVKLQGFNVATPQYETLVMNGNYSTNITVTVDANKEYIIHFPDSSSKYPYTVFLWSEKADIDYPVLIMVRQQKEATSWEIPLLVKSRQGMLNFYSTARTLCHNNINALYEMPRNILYSSKPEDIYKLGILKRLSMSISTSSNVPTPVTLRVEEQEDFFVEENQNISFVISPSEPRYFYYRYSNKKLDSFQDTVILEVDSQDDTCLTVSIQDITCPVFDLNEDIAYEGEFETVDTRGGLIINEKDFPRGFFVVFVSKGDDYDCIQKGSLIPQQNFHVGKALNRSSKVSFRILPNISRSEYWVASLLTLLAIAVFYFIFIGVTCGLCCWENRRPNNQEIEVVNQETEQLLPREESAVEGEPGNRPSTSGENGNGVADILTAPPEPSQQRLGASSLDLYRSCNETVQNVDQTGDSNASVTDVDSDTIDDRVDYLLKAPVLYLSDLATQEDFHKESCNYLWHVLTVGIFYAVPVVQLAVTQQMVLHETGNLDICYYNFLCAHPLSVFSDFNHFFSNIAYLAAGIFFLVDTIKKRKPMTQNRDCGIPKHNGLYYAMSAALVMEGVLSACYHICPSKSNFQFDTSFMYVMAVLCIVKLYQNRHPDINVTAYVTFAVLAAAIIIVVVGIFEGTLVMWSLFITFYTLAIICLAVRVYYVHHPLRGIALFRKVRQESGLWQALKPIKKDRYIVLVIATTANIIAVNLGYYCYSAGWDFPTFLLCLLMGNAIFHTAIYITLKVIFEKFKIIPIKSIIFIILAACTWGGALYFFVKHSSEWGVTAAKSRERNTHCVLLNFYDDHDIWHVLSATALFFSFMLLSSIDDKLVNVSRTRIRVF